MTPLLTLDEVAAEIRVPKASLKSAAEQHGFLIRMDRAMRIDPKTIPELYEKCRAQPKEQGSTNSSTACTGTSETRDNPTAQRVAQAAAKLKKPLAHTSPQKGAKVLPMSRKT